MVVGNRVGGKKGKERREKEERGDIYETSPGPLADTIVAQGGARVDRMIARFRCPKDWETPHEACDLTRQPYDDKRLGERLGHESTLDALAG